MGAAPQVEFKINQLMKSRFRLAIIIELNLCLKWKKDQITGQQMRSNYQEDLVGTKDWTIMFVSIEEIGAS